MDDNGNVREDFKLPAGHDDAEQSPGRFRLPGTRARSSSSRCQVHEPGAGERPEGGAQERGLSERRESASARGGGGASAAGDSLLFPRARSSLAKRGGTHTNFVVFLVVRFSYSLSRKRNEAARHGSRNDAPPLDPRGRPSRRLKRCDFPPDETREKVFSRFRSQSSVCARIFADSIVDGRLPRCLPPGGGASRRGSGAGRVSRPTLRHASRE